MKKPWMIAAAILLLAACNQDEKNQNVNEAGKTDQSVSPEQSKKENQILEKPEDSQPEKDDSSIKLEAEFFNDIQIIRDIPTITNADNPLVLVNKEYALPAEYVPDDLIRPNVAFSFGDQDIEKSYLRQEAAISLEQMFTQAKKEGIELLAASGFRSYDTQVFLFEREVENVGKEKAIQAVAIPGKSEHQTGLTMDITAGSVDFLLTESFEATTEGKWLGNNAHKYGYILRYPKDKEEVTGYQYEPWHFRYVGVDVATIIFEKKWTLEEYFEHVEKM